MHHLSAEQAATRLAVQPEPAADRQGLQLRIGEVDETDGEFIAGLIADLADPLPARPQPNLAVHQTALGEGMLAAAQRTDRGDAGLILVAQRQVEDAMPRLGEPKPGKTAHTTSTASTSTSAPRGRLATPTAARAG